MYKIFILLIIIIIVYFIVYRKKNIDYKLIVRNKKDTKKYEEIFREIELDYTLSFWLYVDDWNYMFGENKNVISINGNNVNIYLDKYKNNLIIEYSSYIINSSLNEFTINNIPLQKWFNVSICFDIQHIDIYFNGKLLSSKITNTTKNDNIMIENNYDYYIYYKLINSDYKTIIINEGRYTIEEINNKIQNDTKNDIITISKDDKDDKDDIYIKITVKYQTDNTYLVYPTIKLSEKLRMKLGFSDELSFQETHELSSMLNPDQNSEIQNIINNKDSNIDEFDTLLNDNNIKQEKSIVSTNKATLPNNELELNTKRHIMLCKSGGFSGSLNNLKYYNKILSPEQIKNIYENEHKQIFMKNIVNSYNASVTFYEDDNDNVKYYLR